MRLEVRPGDWLPPRRAIFFNPPPDGLVSTFLGVSVDTWLNVIECAKRRGITVDQLVSLIEDKDPIYQNLTPWMNQFGFLAEIRLIEEGW